MAWYDTGTISLTNGNTTVTGAGTDFISGAQIGEALYAPDGNLYEIQSITSATVLVLADNYLGSTVSGQDYKIIPTQSLVADLAGQVTDLITDYSDVKDGAGAGKFNDGTVTSPAITFEQDQNNGLYRIGSDNYGLSAGGTKQIDISTTDVELNHSGSKKLATTSTGVDVTGTVTADNLTVDAGAANQVASFSSTDAGAFVYIQDSNALGYYHGSSSGTYVVRDTDNKNRINISSGGDVEFYEDTGTTAKMVWSSSSEALGLRTSSPTGILDLNISTNARGYFSDVVGEVGSGNFALQVVDSAGTSLKPFGIRAEDIRFVTGSTERMRIDSSGNVGIGTDNPIRKLHIYESGTGNVGVEIDNPQTGEACTIGKQGDTAYGATSVGDSHLYTYDSNITLMADGGAGNTSSIKFATGGNSERARIDSSGNLLVGKTSVNDTVAGQELLATGVTRLTSDGAGAIYLNRKTSDGDIAVFRKDGSTVGSIGTASGDLCVGVGNTFWRYTGSSEIVPAASSDGNGSDGVISLGNSGRRLKDLYLSGGVVFPDAGGIGSATNNKLDSYEEGDFTPTVSGSTTTGTATYLSGRRVGKYVKIGSFVYFSITVGWTAHTGAGQIIISGLPFTRVSGLEGQTSGVIGYNNGLGCTSGSQINIYIDGSSRVNFTQTNSEGTNTQLPLDTYVPEIIMSGHYRTNS